MNILITAPSLDTSKNVSGVSTLVNTIIEHNKTHTYYHYLLGKPDKPIPKVLWMAQFIKRLLFFPFALKNQKIELVHQNLPFDPKGVTREYIINLWCRLMGVPVVLHVHGGLFMTKEIKNIFFKQLSLSILNNSSSVVVLSKIEKEVLKNQLGYKFAKVLPNSIDTAVYGLNTARELKKVPCLLYLGRIEKNKGIYELIDALKRLNNEIKFKFVLCGAGPLTDYCIEKCNGFLGNDFKYKGVVFGERKIETIIQSDLFILPSYFEGLPMSLLETMAASVVPVITEVGSIKHIIRHGKNGLIVEKQNAQDLYQKLKYILTNPVLYQTMSENARKTIVEDYDVKNYIVELNKIYDSVHLSKRLQ